MMEITFRLMIACTRQLVFSVRAMRKGTWESPLCNRLVDLTLGLVGLGSIGIRVAKVAKAFNMRTIAWSQNLTADVVSRQIRLSDRTEGMNTRADFDLMKPSANFINTSRGGLVNGPDLIDTLKNSRIARAGLDVAAVEPLPLDSALCSLDDTILTAHLGYSAPSQFQAITSRWSRTSPRGKPASRSAN